MNEEQIKAAFKEVVSESHSQLKDELQKSTGELISTEVAASVRKITDQMKLDRVMHGRDVSGVSDETKIAFIQDIKNIVRGEKAAMLENNDSTGGYLVPAELWAGIKRIAATVGLVARDATMFPMSTDEMDVPRYTGATLQGEYVGEDEEGDETSVSIGDAKLMTKTWMLIIRVGNTLLADATVDVADWLMGLAAEGLAYRLDREGFTGGSFAGSPFVGLLGDTSEIAVHTMATGATQFDDFGIVEASDAIGAVPTAALNDAGFYFHRTVWAKIRSRSTNGVFEFGQYQPMLATLRRENGIQPVGEILGYPVYTTDVLPSNSQTAISKKFGFFGSISNALYVGDRGPMEIMKSEHATVGGKSVFRANQTAIRFTHRHSVTIGLPSAGVAIKTAAA